MHDDEVVAWIDFQDEVVVDLDDGVVGLVIDFLDGSAEEDVGDAMSSWGVHGVEVVDQQSIPWVVETFVVKILVQSLVVVVNVVVVVFVV